MSAVLAERPARGPKTLTQNAHVLNQLFVARACAEQLVIDGFTVLSVDLGRCGKPRMTIQNCSRVSNLHGVMMVHSWGPHGPECVMVAIVRDCQVQWRVVGPEMTCRNAWSRVELQQATQMNERKMSVPEISRVTGRSPDAVKSKLAELRSYRLFAAQSSARGCETRACLKCGQTFISDRLGNRLCNYCNGTNSGYPASAVGLSAGRDFS